MSSLLLPLLAAGGAHGDLVEGDFLSWVILFAPLLVAALVLVVPYLQKNGKVAGLLAIASVAAGLLITFFRYFLPGIGAKGMVVHEAIDPEGRDAATDGAPTAGGGRQTAYLRWQNLGLLLARHISDELARGGQPPAERPLALAPLHVLSRTDGPSASIALGYLTNERDRARIAESGWVESAARALAQGILDFDRRLRSAETTTGGWRR